MQELNGVVANFAQCVRAVLAKGQGQRAQGLGGGCTRATGLTAAGDLLGRDYMKTLFRVVVMLLCFNNAARR